MKILTKEQILLLHSQLVKEFGGSLDIRDDSLFRISYQYTIPNIRWRGTVSDFIG